jgi:hypothetical protein
MIFNDNYGILFIEPEFSTIKSKCLDDISLKFLYIIRNYAVEIGNYNGVIKKRKKIVRVCWDNSTITMGTHECTGCKKVHSSSFDVKIHVPQNKPFYTNTLCMHYLVHHRDSIPKETLEFIKNINIGNIIIDYGIASINCGVLYDTPFDQKFLDIEYERLFNWK